MATRFAVPITQLVNNDASSTASGWKLNAYETGTTTRKDTFSDNALSVANANPVVADSAGRFGDIFLESGTYRFILTDADDVEIWDADPVEGSIGSSGAVDEKTGAYTVTVDDATKIIAVDASSGAITITLLAAATAGDGFEVTVKKTDSSANIVTIDGNGSETIDGSTTLGLRAQDQSVTLRCDGSNWQVVSSYGMSDGIVGWRKGADIASASPLVLGTDGNYFDVTGTTGFSTITVAAGTLFMLQFDAALTLTHGASLDLPGEANITTAAGDRLIGFAEAADTVQVLSYIPAGAAPIPATQSEVEAGTATNRVLTPANANDLAGVAKGWRLFSVSGGTVTDDAGHNVDATTDNAAGDFTINWTTDFSDADYVAVGTCDFAGGGDPLAVQDVAKTAGTWNIETAMRDVGTADPAGDVNAIALGDQ